MIGKKSFLIDDKNIRRFMPGLLSAGFCLLVTLLATNFPSCHIGINTLIFRTNQIACSVHWWLIMGFKSKKEYREKM